MGYLKDLREAKKLVGEIGTLGSRVGNRSEGGGGGGGGGAASEQSVFITNVSINGERAPSLAGSTSPEGLRRIGGNDLGQQILSALQRLQGDGNLGSILVRTGG